ncbi:toxin glutamine deamidase domain-containing protein [Actinomadura opuntiae]|uniref:toxin glutamine deamidase domain-containing protein n=1 Tax=Actinomadura sp. OS1-43 TaxID=604315 RepID=UPI00255A7726|nr:toxin glutamine deamidase domain-containing protein [Actinomadura sp. OS1-43]MDL4817860.1 toxin glutamine deamidase domain-containing protein [Actinomadura sp. OS1-43]
MTEPAQLEGSRTSNALECALAFLKTWYGEPTAAGSVRYDPADALSILRGEPHARERAESTLGAAFRYIGPDAAALDAIRDRLLQLGHGHTALIVNGWHPSEGTGTHAWNACNHEGRIAWMDTCRGERGPEPLYPDVHGVWAIITDAAGRGMP